MSEQLVKQRQRDAKKRAKKMLEMSAKFWFMVMAIGQWIFVTYVIVHYGIKGLSIGLEAFKNPVSTGGYIPGDTVGNLILVLHVLVAIVIFGGGPLQLIPQFRAQFPKFHRWNGRAYMLTSVLICLAGFYLIWFREAVGEPIQHVGTTISGVLAIIFACVAFKCALARDFVAHRRWALRLFMVVSAVWFIRLSIYGWIYVTGGAGIDFSTFTGPFLTFIHYAQFIVPLALLELYYWAQTKAEAAGKFAVAGSLFIATLCMGVGIFAISSASWVPKIMSL